MPKCVYCGKDYEFPKGLTLIGKDGKVNYLCSAKCRKNMKMKRRKVRWILKKKSNAHEDTLRIKKKDKKEQLIPEVPKEVVRDENSS